MMRLFILTNSILISFAATAIAQPAQETVIKLDPTKKGPQTTQVIPGVSITIDDGQAAENIEYKPSSKIFVNAGNSYELRLGKRDTTSSFTVSVTAGENTEIRAEIIPDKKDAVAFSLNRDYNKIKAGQNVSFNFTAIGPQSGTIHFYNKLGLVAASSRYNVLAYKSVRQSLNTSINSNLNFLGGDIDTGPNVNLSYNRSTDNWSGSFGVNYGPSGVNVNVSSSFSW